MRVSDIGFGPTKMGVWMPIANVGASCAPAPRSTSCSNGTRSVAVVGISPDSARPSHRVAAYLLGATDWTVYFVNPNIDTVLGRQVHPSLADLPEPSLTSSTCSGAPSTCRR